VLIILSGRENIIHPHFENIYRVFIAISKCGFPKFYVNLRVIVFHPLLILNQSTASLTVDKVGIKNNPRFPANNYYYNSFIYRIIVVDRLN